MARALRPPTRRVNQGSGHSYYIDGVKAPGVTSIIKVVGGGGGLIRWAASKAAECAVENRRSQLDDQAFADLCRGAPNRDRDAAAGKGTEVHRFAALLNEGREITYPDVLAGHVNAHCDFLERVQPEVEMVETTVINRRYRYAGTLDLVATLPDLGRTLIDVKTSRSGPFGEVGLQLIAYGRAESYLDQDNQERPMPAIDSYAVLWLTGDSWELYPYDVGDREFRCFLFAQQIYLWLEERVQVVRGAPLTRPPALRVVS